MNEWVIANEWIFKWFFLVLISIWQFHNSFAKFSSLKYYCNEKVLVKIIISLHIRKTFRKMSSKQPRCVLLDVGGVVTPSPFPGLARTAKGYKMKPDDLKKKMQTLHNLWAKCERGQANVTEYLHAVRSKFGVDLAPWLNDIVSAPPHPQMPRSRQTQRS